MNSMIVTDTRLTSGPRQGDHRLSHHPRNERATTMKFHRRALLSAAAAIPVAAAASACGLTAEDGGSDGGPLTGLRIMVPNSPGGGYDTTARSIARIMEDETIAKGIEV